MVWIILCMAGYILSAFSVTSLKKKKMGKAVLITNSIMSSREILYMSFRGVLAVVVALLVRAGSYIENPYHLTAVLCLVALYAGYLLFPIVCWGIFGKEMGIYENGVFTYRGILEYPKMKEYVIDKNKNPGGQDMTVYCKTMLPAPFNIKHFDVSGSQAKIIDTYFKKKHNEIKNKNGKKKNNR